MKKLTVLITMLVLLSAWGKPIATAQGMTTNSRPAVPTVQVPSLPTVQVSGGDFVCGGLIFIMVLVLYNVLAFYLALSGGRHKFALKSKIPGKPLPEGEVLTTAEASMLIDPKSIDMLLSSEKLVKPALRELLFQQLLELRTEEYYTFLQVAPGALNRLPRESCLYSFLKAFADHGMLVFFQNQEMKFSLRREGHEKFWDDLDYFDNHIRTHLVDRGLLEEWIYEHKLWFVLVPTLTLHRLTQSGEAVSLRLKAQLDQARLIPQLLESNPAQANELILSLGNLLLLVNELKPHYARLASVLHNQQYSILETFDKMIVNISIPPPRPSSND